MSSFDWAAGHAATQQHFSAFLQTLKTGQAQEIGQVRESENAPWPWVMFIELTVIQLLLNIFMRLFVVQPAARRMMLATTNRPNKVSHKKVEKFAQATMEMLFYSIYFVMGYRVIKSQLWIWPSHLWWVDQPNNRSITDDMAFFYIAYCARYFQNFIMVFLEPRRKDFIEMQLHHFITCLLIYLSYGHGYVRVGCIIMVLLDIADPPLHAAKQVVYLKDVSAKQAGIFTWANIADVFFVVFALSFTFTRMVLYPYVVWSVTVELYEALLDENTKLLPVTPRLYYDTIGGSTVIMVGLVWVLQFLQVFWFVLLVKAIKNVLMGSELKDNRSDSEASDTEGDSRKKK